MVKLEMKMHLFMCVAAAITQLCYSKTPECIPKVMSVDEIKVGNGYKYSFPPNATEVEVYQGKTLIAFCNGNLSYDKSVVKSMNMSAIITNDSLNLTVKLFFYNGAFLTDYCVEYRVTENRPEASQPQIVRLGLSVPEIIGISGITGIFLITGIFVILYLRFSKGTQQAEPQTVGAFPGILRYLKYISSHREGISQSRGARGHERTEAGGHSGGDVEGQQLSSPHEDAHSIDPEHDGGAAVTPASIQMSNNENSVVVSVTNGNAAWNRRAMHRSTRDDPGGPEDNRGGDAVPNREANECSRVDQMEEGKPLLSDQRNPDRGLDVGDEAAFLVNKRDFDKDQVGRGSIDVESIPLDGGTVNK